MLTNRLTDLGPTHLVIDVHLADHATAKLPHISGELRDPLKHLGEGLGLFSAGRFGQRGSHLGGWILHGSHCSGYPFGWE